MAIKFLNTVAVDNNVLFVDTVNDQVGIGTASPADKLHVSGGAIRLDNFYQLRWGGTGTGIYGHSSQGLNFFTDSGTTRLKIEDGGNVGINTTSPLSKFQVNGQASVLGNSFNGLAYFNGTNALASYNTANKIVMSSNGSADGLYTGGLHLTRRALTQQGHFGSGIRGISVGTVLQDNALELYTSTNTQQNATRLKITSNGNVGIGTTSPGSKLEVNGSIDAGGDGYLINGMGWALENSGVLTLGDWDGQEFSTRIMDNNSSEVLRVTDGKVGIGVTGPSFKLDLGDSTDSNNMFRLNGNFSDVLFSGNVSAPTGGVGLWNFINTGTNATKRFYVQDANNSDSRLTFDFKGNGGAIDILAGTSSGNVGIGTTSPDSLLNLEGAKNTSIITLGSTTNNSSWSVGDKIGAINFYSADGSGAGAGVKASISYEVEAGTTGSTNSMIFRSAGTGAGTNNTERMRIDSAGNVGIGTTSPSAKLEINDASAPKMRFGRGSSYYWDIGHTSSDFQIQSQTGGTIMHLNYDGNVGIGTTSPTEKLDVAGIIQSNLNGFQIDTGSYGDIRLRAFYGALNTSATLYVGGVNGYSWRPVYASAFNVSSDYRLKTNVVDLEEAIERVKQINVHRFNWKDRLDEEKVDGFLAHELAEVIPEAVTGEKDAVREDGTLDYQGVDQSKVVPLLTAALQEAISKIEQLETRIQTLENN